MDDTSLQWVGQNLARAGDLWNATVYLCKMTKDLGLFMQAKKSHVVATSMEAQRALDKYFQKMRMEPKPHARNLGK